ncbi:MAG: ABC transporter permease [Candidatus Hydrogenedentes bacterium]|nr:ABC transporter permease [Candidatus Hydrogenedentota bacterium]
MNDLLPLGALVRRELVRSLRRPVSLRWVAYVVAAAAFFSLVAYPSGDAAPMQLRAASQGVFSAGMVILFLAGVFLVPPVAASSIVLEREQDTYELLWLTMLGPWGIALAKTLNAVGYFLLMSIASLPVICVSAFLVGVDVALIIVAYLTVLAAALTSASIGVMCSAEAKSTAGAVFSSYVLIFLLFIGCLLPIGIFKSIFEGLLPQAYWNPATLLSLIWSASPVVSLSRILRSPAEVWDNFGGSVLALGVQAAISYLVISKAAGMLGRPRELQTYHNPPGTPNRLPRHSTDAPPIRLAPPLPDSIDYISWLGILPRIEDGTNPVFAREQLQSRLSLRMSDKSAALLFIAALILFGLALVFTAALAGEGFALAYVWTILLLLAPTVVVPIVAAPLWARERELDTFDALRMTPQSAWDIVTGKAYAAVRATTKIYGLFMVFVCPVLLGMLIEPISTVCYIATIIVLAVTTFELVAVCVNAGMSSKRSASAIVANIMLLGLVHVFPFQLSFAFIGGEATSPWLDLWPVVLSPAIASVVLLSYVSDYPILAPVTVLVSCTIHTGIAFLLLRIASRHYTLRYARAD